MLTFYLFAIIMTISILTIYEIIITVHHDKGPLEAESTEPDVLSHYSEEIPPYEPSVSEGEEKDSLLKKNNNDHQDADEQQP